MKTRRTKSRGIEKQISTTEEGKNKRKKKQKKGQPEEQTNRKKAQEEQKNESWIRSSVSSSIPSRWQSSKQEVL